MATPDSNAIDLKPAPLDPKTLSNMLQEISSTLYYIKGLASQGTTIGKPATALVAIEAMAAQAGYRTDVVIRMTGELGLVGDYDDWLEVHD